MPDDRPMPLTGEDAIPPHPQLGEAQDNFPSRRLVLLVRGWSVLIGISLLVNIGVWNVEAVWLAPLLIGIFGTLATVLGWWVLGHWNKEVILYEHGFTYREGSKNIPFRYAEIAAIRIRAEQQSIFGGMVKRIVYDITMRSHAGDHIKMDNVYRRVATLGDKLMTAVYAQLRPSIATAIANGLAVSFGGGLQVDANGLIVSADVLENATDDAQLLWQNFGGYRVQNRQLQLQTKTDQTWFALPLIEVENLVLLLEILREHRPQETQA